MPLDADWTDEKGVQHRGLVCADVDGRKVIACTTCGFRHVIPLPSADDLRQFYEEDFYQTEKATYLKASADDIDWKNSEFSRRFVAVERLLEKRTGKAALDIGCGPGEFLALGKARGWQVTGVEPSPVAADHARSQGVEVITGFFGADLAEKLGTYDFIHMSEVLEHVPDPGETLRLAYGLLNPGGMMCVSVPNDFSPVQAALVATGEYHPWWVVPDHHLNYFDFTTLGALMEKTGLQVVRKTTGFPMEIFLLMGQNYTKDPSLGKKLHGWRKNLDLTLSAHAPVLHDTFYESLAGAGIGRLAVLFGRKHMD